MASQHALALLLFSVGTFVGSDAARIARKRRGTAVAADTKFIAGIPVMNYNLAYGGQSVMDGGDLFENWVLVVKPETTDETVKGLCEMSKCVRMGHPSKGGVPYFEVHGTEKDLEAVVEAGSKAIKFIEPDLEVHLIPELEDDVQPSATSWGLDRIAASLRANEGQGSHIYILDTGIRASHNDFGGRVIPTLDLTSNTINECKGAAGCAADKQGHGTHCAGTSAGTTYGVAPQATLHSVKVLGDDGSGSWSWSYDALDWLATEGERPAVASMSLGGSGTQNAMKEAVNTAVNAGVVVVVAGGNSNSDACSFSPAFVPSAITVGSTTSTDARSSFSNYGRCTEIWAPGSSITSASHKDDTGSATFSGTSMACPHVSGAVALVLEQTPGATSAQALQTLLDNAVTNAITGLRSGDTNKLLYVGAGGPPPTPAPAPTPVPPPSICPEAYSAGPDRDGDCKCFSGMRCYEGGEPKCTYSYTGNYGYKSYNYFLPFCTSCECK